MCVCSLSMCVANVVSALFADSRPSHVWLPAACLMWFLMIPVSMAVTSSDGMFIPPLYNLSLKVQCLVVYAFIHF